MTKDEIKKGLECCITLKADSCKECPYGNTDCSSDKLQRDALNLITEQEKSIQVAQDNILAVAQQNQEYREQQVKHAKIEVLKELKDMLSDKPNGWSYIIYIDDIIKELQNGTK